MTVRERLTDVGNDIGKDAAHEIEGGEFPFSEMFFKCRTEENEGK